ncbi:haloacid dehalogenase type II [Streptomyces venetus]|uniref:Haloacid dehalogenase type II n=1 Tax=Streptomyces venetus TaxID=1701086 RepID=A0ABP8FV62_9ACTN
MSSRPVVSFDCYRTLIDFDLNRATLPIVRDRLDEVGVDHEVFLDNLRVMRFQGVVQPYRRYRDILRDTLENCMLLHGVEYRDEDYEQLVAAAERFPVFPDVPDALRRLKEGYDIAILTNSDNDLIPHHLETIGVPFDHVVTAEQAGAYKPRRQAFEKLFEVLPQRRDQITHAAQGWDYDIMPTKDLGLARRVWVNRYGLKGSDAFQPYDEIRDLSELPALLGL